MKTRIIIIIIGFKVLLALDATAQDKDRAIYFKVYGGYSLFTPGASFFSTLNSPLINSSPGSFSGNGKTLGSGSNFGIGANKEVTRLLIAGIDINYLSGSKLIANNYYGSSLGAPIPYDDIKHRSSTSSASATHSVLSIIPNISFKVLPATNYYVYTKLGLIVAVKTKLDLKERDSLIDSSPDAYNDVSNSTFTAKYPVNLGLQIATGVKFKLTSNIKGFVELSSNILKTTSNSYFYYEQVTDRQNGKIYIFTETYNKSFKNIGNGATPPTTSGNVTTQNYLSNGITNTLFSTYQNINNVMLNMGVTVGFK